MNWPIRVLRTIRSAAFPGEVNSPLMRKRVAWMATVVCPVPDGAACVGRVAGWSDVIHAARRSTASAPTPKRRFPIFTALFLLLLLGLTDKRRRRRCRFRDDRGRAHSRYRS